MKLRTCFESGYSHETFKLEGTFEITSTIQLFTNEETHPEVSSNFTVVNVLTTLMELSSIANQVLQFLYCEYITIKQCSKVFYSSYSHMISS